eukprot:gene15008-20193_t
MDSFTCGIFDLNGSFKSDDNDQFQIVSIGLATANTSHTFRLVVAPNDFNKDKKCLFATMIWQGSILLSEFLNQRSIVDIYIKGNSIIEFGSAAGLPSLTCHQNFAKLVCASDYPANEVINNLKLNILNNKKINDISVMSTNDSRSDASDGIIEVIPHIWGESVEELITVNNGNCYDVVIAAECLWNHNSHQVFLNSINSVLKPRGYLFISYSHHIPGLENEDLNFFKLASQLGIHITESHIME